MPPPPDKNSRQKSSPRTKLFEKKSILLKKEVLNFSCTDPSRAQSQYQQYYNNTELKN